MRDAKSRLQLTDCSRQLSSDGGNLLPGATSRNVASMKPLQVCVRAMQSGLLASFMLSLCVVGLSSLAAS